MKKSPLIYVEYSPILPMEQIGTTLNNDDFQFINKINNHSLKLNSATARFLIRNFLKNNFPNSFNSFIIDYDEFNKPFFKNINDLYFSISHSNNVAIVAISNNNCGIDIEKIKKYKPHIAERFFHKKEFDFIESLNDDKQKEDEFYKIWTIKESYAKFIGKGILLSGINEIYCEGDFFYNSNDEKITSLRHKSQKIFVNDEPYYFSLAYTSDESSFIDSANLFIPSSATSLSE